MRTFGSKFILTCARACARRPPAERARTRVRTRLRHPAARAQTHRRVRARTCARALACAHTARAATHRRAAPQARFGQRRHGFLIERRPAPAASLVRRRVLPGDDEPPPRPVHHRALPAPQAREVHEALWPVARARRDERLLRGAVEADPAHVVVVVVVVERVVLRGARDRAGRRRERGRVAGAAQHHLVQLTLAAS